MAGYIGQAVSFFVEVHKLQKRTRPISRHFYQVLSLVNKGFMIWHLGKFFLWDIVGLSPERARQIPLAHSGNQSQRRIWFILPAHRARHIIQIGTGELLGQPEGMLWMEPVMD